VIELGLVIKIQAGLGPKPMAPGGWAVQLPQNQIAAETPMAWTYRLIDNEASYVLGSASGSRQDPFTSIEVQIDCYGFTMQHAILLARAIDAVFRGGFKGRLDDPDKTWVEGVFRMGPFIDGFNDAARSYVRSIEYRVNYIDQDV
jgi:hypothetical protein